MVFLIVVAVLLVGVVALLALGRLGGVSLAMSDPVSTMGGRGLPDGPITAEDVGSVRFDRTLRGYRMSEVDAVIDRLRAEVADRDYELWRLRQGGDDHSLASGEPAATEPHEFDLDGGLDEGLDSGRTADR